VSGQNEDDAWRSIVENYGDRPPVEPLPPEPEPEPAWYPTYDPDGADRADDPDRFVPPTPPPIPHPPPVRFAAWLGLFGSPAVLLVALVLGISLPAWLAYGLIGAFVGGFGYLVLHMDHEPRDPGDNGARL
jgi:hypothetical protein